MLDISIFDSNATETSQVLRNFSDVQVWYFVTKIFLIYSEKIFSSDRENLLKFEAEGQELAKFLRSFEQFIQTEKGQNSFW